MNDPNIIIACITGAFGLVGGLLVAVVYTHSNERMMEVKEKNQREATEKRDEAQQSLIVYKIEQLQKSQDKHNSIIERTYKIESNVNALSERVDDLSDRVCHIEERGV